MVDGTARFGRAGRPRSVALALAAACVAAALAGSAAAQVIGDPPRATYLGSRPVKGPGGPDVSWNGSAYQVRAGGVIDWSISVVHDLPPEPIVLVSIDDYIPKPSDFPVLPFSLATDVLATPATGNVTLDGDGWLHDRQVEVLLGETVELVFRTKVSGTAPLGSVICNWALVNYAAIPPPGGIAMPTYAYTINSIGQDDSACVVVTSDPNLGESTKTAADASGDGVLEAGEPVTWTITVRNTGASDATGVSVTDDLGPEHAFVSAGQGGTESGGRIAWSSATTPALNRLRPGESATLTFTTTTLCVPDGGAACNQARVACAQVPLPVPTDDPSDAALSSPTCLPTRSAVLAGSTLVASEPSGDGRFAPGETLSFDMVVTNSGGAAASDVQVSVPLPASLLSPSPRNGGTVGGGVVSWTPAGTPGLAAIAPGGSVVLGFDALLDPAAALGSSLCVQAQLAAAGGCPAALSDDPIPRGLEDATCVTLSAPPSLRFELTASNGAGAGPPAPGQTLEYEATITWLSGEAATDVAVTVMTPSGSVLTSLEADDGGATGAASLEWTPAGTPALARIGAGEVVRLRGRGTVACTAPDLATACASGTLSASNLAGALASDDPGLPGASDPSCLALAAPVVVAELSASDADGDGLFEPGEDATLELSLRNEGSAAATDLVVTLPLLAADLGPAPTAGGRVSAGAVTWDAASTPALVSLGPAEEVRLQLVARIDPASAGARRCHQASLAWAELAGCVALVSDDAGQPGADDPTCRDVTGDGLPPGEVPDGDPLDGGPVPVTLRCQGDDLALAWDAAPRALTYLVYRGPMSSFRTSPWTNPAGLIDDPENASTSCGLTALAYLDEAECAGGGADLYYLVAARNLVGDGPLGESVRGGVPSERPPVSNPCP